MSPSTSTITHRGLSWLVGQLDAMPGVLDETSLAIERHRLALRMPGEFAALAGERVLNRLRSLARLIGREPVMLMG